MVAGRSNQTRTSQEGSYSYASFPFQTLNGTTILFDEGNFSWWLVCFVLCSFGRTFEFLHYFSR